MTSKIDDAIVDLINERIRAAQSSNHQRLETVEQASRYFDAKVAEIYARIDQTNVELGQRIDILDAALVSAKQEFGRLLKEAINKSVDERIARLHNDGINPRMEQMVARLNRLAGELSDEAKERLALDRDIQNIEHALGIDLDAEQMLPDIRKMIEALDGKLTNLGEHVDDFDKRRVAMRQATIDQAVEVRMAAQIKESQANANKRHTVPTWLGLFEMLERLVDQCERGDFKDAEGHNIKMNRTFIEAWAMVAQVRRCEGLDINSL